jgi:hypothetical protein
LARHARLYAGIHDFLRPDTSCPALYRVFISWRAVKTWMAVSQFCIGCPQTFVFSFLSNLSSFPPKSPRAALRKHYFIAIAASERAFRHTGDR